MEENDNNIPVAEDNENQPQQAPKKKKKWHLIRPTWLRRTLKTLLCLILFILILPFLIYVPPVQDFLVKIAEKEVKKSTGMDVSIGKFRLKFPLDISLQDLSVVEATGDTMVSAKEALLDVKLLPLLKLDVDVDRLKLDQAYYRLVSPDTSMIMTIRAGFLEVDDQSSVNIKESDIDLNKAIIRDANIQMYTDVWKKKPNPEDTATSPFKIRIGDLAGERIRFGMSSLPTIDTLSIVADKLSLKEGLINLETSRITANELTADGGEFTFLTPTPEYIKAHPAPIDTISPESPPMVIMGKQVAITNFKGLYGVAGAKPLPGFDANYLQLSGVDIELENFYNETSTLRLPIKTLRASERCGLKITEGSGLVEMDSTGIKLDNLRIRTPYSKLDVTADLPFELLELKPYAPVNIYALASIGLPDVTAFMPSLKQYTKLIRTSKPIDLALDARGTLKDLDISMLNLSVPTVLSLRASGTAQNPLDPKYLAAHVNIDGELTDPSLIEHFTGNLGFKLPSMKIEGEAGVNRNTYTADLAVLTPKGDIAAKGDVNLNAETYNVHLLVKNFNAGYFVPDIGLGIVNATLDAKGDGFNPTKPGASTDVTLHVDNIEYKNLTFHDLALKASLASNHYDVKLSSPNPEADLDLSLEGIIAKDDYSANGYIQARNINLKALGLDTAVNGGSFDIQIDGKASPDKWLYDVNLTVNNLYWELPNDTIDLPEGLKAYLLATTDTVSLSLDCQDTRLLFDSPESLPNLMDKFGGAAMAVMEVVESRELMVDTLQKMLPRFDLSVYSPGHGLVERFLKPTGIAFDSVAVDLKNDSIISGFADLWGLKTEKMEIDTISLDLQQRNYLLDYKLHIGNQPGNLDEFADVNVNGYVGGNRLSAYLTQKNAAGETGYKLGFTAALTENNEVTLHFTPLNAMIGYMPWTLNADNYIDLDLDTYMVEANLEGSSEESSILVETKPGADNQQELHLKLTDIKVQDFMQMSVTAPPLTATINSDIRARYTGSELVGIGRISVTDFTYDNVKVDDLNLKLQASMNEDETYDASVTLNVENNKDALAVSTKLISGDEGLEPEYVKLNLNKFPLSAANPFLGNDVAQLQGTLSGEMDLTGGFTKPILNGSITCDSTAVYLPIMGSALRFDTEPLTVTDNVIRFNNFDIWGANDNPLTINGTIDAQKLNDILLDISASANNFGLINNDKRAGSDIYGKVFLNFTASAVGPLTRFAANANLNILGSTDVTYAIPDANTALQAEKNSNVVKFVNFNDTTSFHPEPAEESVFMKLNAAVTITPGAQVTVLLSSNGTDRVQLNPYGTINLYRNYMGDITLNGQLNTGNGSARYNIPVIGNKEFVFDPASYVLWNGPMLNPVLNIKATDQMKVSVSQNGGNSQLVNFLVKLDISGTLESPSLLFDLATDDDMTIQNQLQGMTADQRNSAAMNLLITGQYSAGGISTNTGPITSNVYNFLAQQVNSWAAKNIRGVDLSFGVNQYDMTTDGQNSTATSYSYQLSKSLFNNRFKISVGGNYSTDDSTDDNLTQNLISDISFEYILRQTQSQTMLVKLFRHNGYESILEGEITEMGAGFVYKRKLGDFKTLFRFRRRKRNDATKSTTTATDSVGTTTSSK